MNTTSFQKDIYRGKIGETIFINDFLDFLKIKYENVTEKQSFQIIDSDFLAKIGTYEIKTNYRDDKILIIEEYTNINEILAPVSMGWFYKSKADILVFISKNTRTMILLPFTDEFKRHYETIKEKFALCKNKISQHNGRQWQSAFRRIPLEALSGYFSMYKRSIDV